MVTKITAQDLTENEIVEQAEREMKKETLENWNPGRVFDSEIREEIERRFSFIYPYQYLEDLPVKVSVSELKREVTTVNRILKRRWIMRRKKKFSR